MRTLVLTSVLCSLGVALSAYALYVETKKQQDSSYTAGCDISASMSCSKVFTSKYGKGFGLLEYIIGKDHPLNLPNSCFGFAFYILQFFFELSASLFSAKAQIAMSTLANLGSVYLAFILVFVLEDICVVCVSTYIVKFIILVSNILKWRHLNRKVSSSSGKKRVNGTKKNK